MHRRWRLLIVPAILLAAVLLFGGGVARAHSFRSGDNVVASSSEKIDHSLFIAGRSVDVSSEVNGDVFCAGQTVTISGTVHGDVLCAGQTINIGGKVDGDVRLAGQTVSLGAVVGGNATIAGQSFVMDSRARIGGDLTTGATDATLNGTIGRDVAMGGDTGIIGNMVGRNVTATTNHLRLTAGARVAGNIQLTSREDVNRDSAAVVGGKISRSEPRESQQQQHRRWMFGFNVAFVGYVFFSLLLVAMFLALLLPRLLETVTNQAMPSPWRAILVGLIAGIVAPALMFIIGLTIIGIPLAILLGVAWLLIVATSGPFFAYYIGRLLFRGTRNSLLTMLVGGAILIGLYFIPFLNILVLLVALWAGSGMLLLELFKRTPRPLYRHD